MSNVGSAEWEVECKRRIHQLFASIHVEHPTLARAQEIMGGYGDADDMLGYLVEKRDVMNVPGDKSRYEFTFQGLSNYMASLLPEAEREMGRGLDELKFATWCSRHSRKVAAG